MVSASPAFRTTVSPFRLNDGLPGVPFHRRGLGKPSEPGQRQRSDGNYTSEYATKYSGTMSPGLKTDDVNKSVDIKPHSLRVEKADRSRPTSPMFSPAPGIPAATAGKKLMGEQRFSQNPPQESPWAEQEFQHVRDAFNKDKTHLSHGIVQPRNDPLGHGSFDEERSLRWRLRLKTPQPPVHQYDLTGVFNRDPVRRYYTINQMFYSWPIATVYQYSLNPTRPKSGLQ